MAESIIQNVMKSDFDRGSLVKWLNSTTEQFDQDFECTRAEFVACFLNYIHEEASKGGNEAADLDESHEGPSVETPQIKSPRVLASPQIKTPDYRCSPVSPLYRNANFITPKREKVEKIPRSQTPLCIGDFVCVTKNNSKQKKKRYSKGETPSAEKPKRINPTKLEFPSNRVDSKDNSFNFKQACGDFSRDSLVEERHTILAKQSPMRIKLNGVTTKEIIITKTIPDVKKVTKRPLLDALVEIYSCVLATTYVNSGREMVFLMNLLFHTHHEGDVFESVHNLVYFASKTIERRKNVLSNYDKPTLSLLSKHEAILNFTPQLAEEIAKIATLKTERRLEAFRETKNVCFDTDMDNRTNFASVDSFNAWRKQRDLFYQILKIWSDKHHVRGFNFAVGLGGKIKALLSLHSDPSNMVRFSMLFLKQLLSCSSLENMDGLAQLPIDSEKLSLLTNRLETKRTGVAPSGFVGREEFYRDFIVVAENQLFIRHLFDAIVCEIADLNETKFNLDENCADVTSRNAYHACIKSLRTLAKFLGFIEAMPYKNPSATVQTYPEAIMTHLLRIRQVTIPSFDCHKFLQDAMMDRTLVQVIPWLTKYLAMLDQVTLNLPYYQKVLHILFEIHKTFRSRVERNVILVRSCLNTLFETPYISNFYSSWCKSNSNYSDTNHVVDNVGFLDNSDIVDQNVMYLCCPDMEQVKDILLTRSNKSFAKHITPVSASSKSVSQPNRSGHEYEEAFLNSQSTSVRKTVDFLSDRLSSSCVKYICSCVPEYKERFAASVRKNSLPGKPPCYRTAFEDFRKELVKNVADDLEKKIETTVDALMAREELPEVKRVVFWIVRTRCLETVIGWMETRMTEDMFKTCYEKLEEENKDEEIDRDSVDVERKPVFALPPCGLPGRPWNSECLSAENVLYKIRMFCCDCMDNSPEIDSTEFEKLLESTYMTLTTRCDVNQCISNTICKTITDLVVLAIAYDSSFISETTFKWLEDIWEVPDTHSHLVLNTFVCPRNIKVLCDSSDYTSSFAAFAKLCSKMIVKGHLSADQFETQSTGLYKSEWSEDELKLISQFLRTVIDDYQRQTKDYSQFFCLLEYLSEYCIDL